MTFKNKFIFGMAAAVLLIYISITLISYIAAGVFIFYAGKHFINKILSLKN
mgnify:FL=1|tara:strand:+ start:3746 stop:3898 length:153 start_codon:yes stop_codon:yes gene_type:complete